MKNLMVAASLIQAAGIAKSGTDMFINTLPADTARGVMLRNPLQGVEIDGGMTKFFETEFQVIVRDANPQNGYLTAERIQAALKITHRVIEGIHVSWMEAVTLPVQYPRGDNGAIETSFDVRVGFGVI